MQIRTFAGVATLAAVFATSALAAPDPTLHDKALELLTKGIAFRTVIPGDQVPVYAAYLKSVLVQSGFKPQDVTITPVAGSATLTARYPGTDPKKKPILIIDHMDVVEANPPTGPAIRSPRWWRTGTSSDAARWTTSSTSRSWSPCWAS